MSTFPRSPKSTLGYNVAEVDEFLQAARRAFDGEATASTVLTATDVRHTAFSMAKGGYSAQHVDAALERLEDAFAERENESARQKSGDAVWFQRARASAQEILNRLQRRSGHRFERVSILTLGYHRDDVDRFSGRLVKYFQDGRPVSVEEVRTVTFREQRGGYREAQVDLLLDSVVEVMLAVR